jgi:hypothetical protein
MVASTTMTISRSVCRSSPRLSDLVVPPAQSTSPSQTDQLAIWRGGDYMHRVVSKPAPSGNARPLRRALPYRTTATEIDKATECGSWGPPFPGVIGSTPHSRASRFARLPNFLVGRGSFLIADYYCASACTVGLEAVSAATGDTEGVWGDKL